MASVPQESLRGERVVLRRYCAGDAAALVAAVTASIEHLRPWMPWIQFEPQTVAQRREFIAQADAEWAAAQNFTFGMFAPDDDGRVIGGTGLHRRGGPGTIEIGYWVHVDHIGHGIATEAARLLTDAALALDGIETVEIHHDRANVASGAVPRKLSYRLVRQYMRAPEAPAQSGVFCAWAVSSVEWRAAAASPASATAAAEPTS